MTSTSTTRRKTRTSTPRVRTGCQTCRKRHIKCDETEPLCLKCAQAGWKCDGYVRRSSNLQPSASDKSVASTTLLESALSITRYSLPFRIPGSQKDRQLLHYFCVQGSYEMAGYLSCDFWTRTVLQESYREPVVRQALVSLSSLHLDYITLATPRTEVARGETLAQYGKALRALGKHLEKPDMNATRTALICCILFYCFEATLGNDQAAMHHLQCGLNTLTSYRQVEGFHETQDMSILSRVFERLDLQATLFDDGRVPNLVLTSDEDREICTTNLGCVEAFSRLDDAYRSLIKLQNWLFHFLTKNTLYKPHEREAIPASVLQEKDHLMKQFNRWMVRFDNIRYQANQDDREQCGIQTLLIHQQVSSMLLEADYPADDSVFGASPNPRAEEVLGLADNVLRLTRHEITLGKTAKNSCRNFSSDTGVVAPLFTLAMKCSDESVCLRATELLATSQRREGLYDAQSMVAIIHQFRDARQQKRVRSEECRIEDATTPSLETLFADELNKTTGGMDRKADFINSLPLATYPQN
ncbi:hypothetical protein P153DRAFT_351139 [Dothidotthia symphoricarpi CBS 119687]|uniref:Zn(2)-C6 fungal-type domain-containing protein n=1 Tax=Dothidotthia symphoricarpi CBS 119687 TaxID=1392245 RepID=A0A6A5ZZV8_9PLEO|nr:uncharacterized protein P153DRAFT_351139 [Dothidotthia symphoricarpi CBS 119687]KAF2124247.1 hypothetical protein P153DRAFT_351139 [Dothidotthia symphoricarpi CBS 119687]